MKFGKAGKPEGINFTLPADHPGTAKVLSTLKKHKNGRPALYAGCAKWNRQDQKSIPRCWLRTLFVK